MAEKLVAIYAARSAPEAHLLQNLLAEEGIEAIVTNEALEGGAGVDILGWPTLARVVVHEHTAARAREIALDFEGRGKEPAQEPGPGETRTASAAPDAWPTCPKCGARRIAVCPVCGVSGSQFRLADSSPDEGDSGAGRQAPAADAAAGLQSLLPEAGSAPPSCGPGGCTVPDRGANQETVAPAGRGVSSSPVPTSPPPMVLCPTCDEPFVPEYLERCEWCGHRFPDGAAPPAVVEPDVDLNQRVILVIFAVVAVVAGAAAYLLFLF